MSKKKTLTEDDIQSERQIGRRGMIAMVGGSLLAGAAATVLASTARAERPEPNASDSDEGNGADPAGRGRTGHTDRDTGGNSDQSGRGVCAERGHTDADSGDAAGRGRGPCR